MTEIKQIRCQTKKALPRRRGLSGSRFQNTADPLHAVPGVKDGGSLAGKDSFEASSTFSSSQASE